VATRIGRLAGRPDLVHVGAIPYRPGEPMRVVADTTMLREGLGWAPRFDLDRGVADTIRWWEARVCQS
jgi:nucleoside-diphosphate-sugar epimerase